MHELSIASAIAEIATEHAGAGRRLTAVDVRIGHLRQVVPASLTFAFGLLAEGVELRIVDVPATGRCRSCGTESVQDGFPMRCAGCQGLDLEVVTGEELLVDAIEVEEALTTTGGI